LQIDSSSRNDNEKLGFGMKRQASIASSVDSNNFETIRHNRRSRNESEHKVIDLKKKAP
jgi:hypothetical protein